ncbi:hypothetical protein BDV95DRAFT_595612 [Massariosphaeria phaeospora]|uniref:Uncharacterized protein n=1 Tax=Massariosphaeria phaeospora TaxID=100035 RepID=A0A7C8MCR7_9PLEO|nr:hypothetical protein BDV95DRAFT_595612 [Massariosphaeria phaeospora]
MSVPAIGENGVIEDYERLAFITGQPLNTQTRWKKRAGPTAPPKAPPTPDTTTTKATADAATTPKAALPIFRTRNRTRSTRTDSFSAPLTRTRNTKLANALPPPPPPSPPLLPTALSLSRTHKTTMHALRMAIVDIYIAGRDAYAANLYGRTGGREIAAQKCEAAKVAHGKAILYDIVRAAKAAHMKLEGAVEKLREGLGGEEEGEAEVGGKEMCGEEVCVMLEKQLEFSRGVFERVAWADEWLGGDAVLDGVRVDWEKDA